jgi:Fe-S-cluster-containing dehydrogenase component
MILTSVSAAAGARTLARIAPSNWTNPAWKAPVTTDQSQMIEGCTASGAETAKAAGAATPMANMFSAGDAKPVRRAGVVEKCTFCYHRISHDLEPACVEACPSNARIFGDQDDQNSEIFKAFKARKSFRLQEEKGTKPNVHYVGRYGVRT